jgi:hypothetical protein
MEYTTTSQITVFSDHMTQLIAKYNNLAKQERTISALITLLTQKGDTNWFIVNISTKIREIITKEPDFMTLIIIPYIEMFPEILHDNCIAWLRQIINLKCNVTVIKNEYLLRSVFIPKDIQDCLSALFKLRTGDDMGFIKKVGVGYYYHTFIKFVSLVMDASKNKTIEKYEESFRGDTDIYKFFTIYMQTIIEAEPVDSQRIILGHFMNYIANQYVVISTQPQPHQHQHQHHLSRLSAPPSYINIIELYFNTEF